MHKAANEGTLNPDGISEIMCEEKANQREKVTISVRSMEKYVKSPDPDRVKDYIMKACDHYHRFLMRQREAR